MTPGNILFISKGFSKPSTRYRARQFEQRLNQDGWKVNYATASGSIINKINILSLAFSANVVIVLRKNFGFMLFHLLRLFSKKLVFDFDDANFLKPDGTHSKTRYSSFKRFMLYSNSIWAGNHYLSQEAKKYTTNVIIIPTAIKPEKYQIDGDKPEDFFDLVWIGSQSTSNYIKQIIPVLETVTESISNLRLKIIADFSVSSNKLQILCIPWSSDIEARELATSHVGLAPMPDDPWTRGKCGLKVLQYMAAGLPVISSYTGVNAQIIHNDQTGFLVGSNKQWIEALEVLHNDKNLCQLMGKQARLDVTQHYSINSIYQLIAENLKEL